MEKYYTPSIEEFHVGFNYEIKTPSLLEFIETVYSEDDFNEGAFIKGTEFRVKYLDESDITYFDYTKVADGQIGHNPNNIDAIKFEKYIFYHGESAKNTLILNIVSKWCLITINEKNIFVGEIKNVSEFRRLLKQLDIL